MCCFSAEDLVKKDIGGKADPYAVITYDHQSFETKVMNFKECALNNVKF